MTIETLQIVLHFEEEDKAWTRFAKVDVPNFWHGHSVPPIAGDLVRIGGRQFTINGRIWDHDGGTTLLRIYLASGHVASDSVFAVALH